MIVSAPPSWTVVVVTGAPAGDKWFCFGRGFGRSVGVAALLFLGGGVFHEVVSVPRTRLQQTGLTVQL